MLVPMLAYSSISINPEAFFTYKYCETLPQIYIKA